MPILLPRLLQTKNGEEVVGGKVGCSEQSTVPFTPRRSSSPVRPRAIRALPWSLSPDESSQSNPRVEITTSSLK